MECCDYRGQIFTAGIWKRQHVKYGGSILKITHECGRRFVGFQEKVRKIAENRYFG
jgi:hypothetical protein